MGSPSILRPIMMTNSRIPSMNFLSAIHWINDPDPFLTQALRIVNRFFGKNTIFWEGLPQGPYDCILALPISLSDRFKAVLEFHRTPFAIVLEHRGTSGTRRGHGDFRLVYQRARRRKREERHIP